MTTAGVRECSFGIVAVAQSVTVVYGSPATSTEDAPYLLVNMQRRGSVDIVKKKPKVNTAQNVKKLGMRFNEQRKPKII